jgi:predicted RNA-binding Zn ribbon-like protein
MPWIGEHSVLDVANTIAVGAGSGRTDVDLFTVPELLERWRQAALDRGVAALPVARLAELRELVSSVLDHLDRHAPLTAQLRADRERVRRCRASGCGMLFLARRRDQTWCSIGCGNRVRARRQQAARSR